jgi:sugar transferase (PEP-CTERM system associated)
MFNPRTAILLGSGVILGRGVAAVAAPIIIVLVVGWRLIVDASAPMFRRKERILILGTGPAGVSLAQEVLTRPELNLYLIGFLSDAAAPRPVHRSVATARAGGDATQRITAGRVEFSGTIEAGKVVRERYGTVVGSAALAPERIDSAPIATRVTPGVIGSASDVARIAIDEQADRVVLSLSERRGTMPVSKLLQLKFQGIKIEEVHDIYERIAGRILLDHLSPSWLILSDGFRKPPLLMAIKRLIDLVIAAVALLTMAPAMVLVAVAIFVEGGPPVLFRQDRVGQHGRVFQIFKFRSMRDDSEDRSARWTSNQDPRITRVGRFIRKFRLDELPQLVNVLLGEMSLVGPRPEQPSFVELLEQKIPYYDQRHTSRPGITGWAQVKYGYGASVEESRTKLEHDLFYIKHLSFALDLAIIFETIKVLLSGRGAK